MTTFQDPPLHSRRAVRQNERDQAQPGDASSSAAPTSASPTELPPEPLTYTTQGRAPVPEYDGPSFRARPTVEPAADAAAPTQPEGGFRPRDFSPEGRRAANNPSWAPQYGGVTDDGVIEHHTQGRVPTPPSAAAAPTSMAAALAAPVPPASGVPAAGRDSADRDSGVEAIEQTLTRRELRALRDAHRLGTTTGDTMLPDAAPAAAGAAPAAAVAPVAAPPTPAPSSRLDSAVAEFDALAAGRDTTPPSQPAVRGRRAAVQPAPVAETPVFQAPAVDTPAVETPAVETQALETPAAEAPIAEAPVADVPVAEEPVAAPIPLVEPPAPTAAAFVPPVAFEQPVYEQPVYEQPPVEQPAVEQPAFEQPAVVQPVFEQLAVAEAPAEQPVAAPPVFAEPVFEQPVAAEQSEYEQPAAEQAPFEQPAAEQAPVEQPAAEQAPSEQPAAEQAPSEQPAAEQAPESPLSAFESLFTPPQPPEPEVVVEVQVAEAPVAEAVFVEPEVQPQSAEALPEIVIPEQAAEQPVPEQVVGISPAAPVETPAAVDDDAAASAPPVGHWSTQAELEDETQNGSATLARGVGIGSAPLTTSALVLPNIPSEFGPNSGEILVTGSIQLPESLSATGAHPAQLDESDLDHLLDPGDSQVASTDSQPVRAIRAVSTHTSSRNVIGTTKPKGNRALTVLIVAASSMAAVVITLLVVGLATGQLG